MIGVGGKAISRKKREAQLAGLSGTGRFRLRRVRTDQGERKPVTADRGHSAVVAPPQFESLTGLLDWYCLPPRPGRAILFGEDELVDIDVLPIGGERGFSLGGRALAFRRLRLWLFASLWSRIEQAEPQPMARDPAKPRVVAPAQGEHVVGSFDDDGFVPSIGRIFFLGDDPGGLDPAAPPVAPLGGMSG
jgi:hypothetical protein